MKKILISFANRMSSVRMRSFLFLGVVAFAVVVADRAEPACAAACTRPPLHPCPTSITVWSNVSIPLYGYGQGTLPNGNAYCAYYAPASEATGGDTFSGAFDRVQGIQVTFAREMGAEACEDSYRNGPDGPDFRGNICYRMPTGNAYEMSLNSQGTKCVDINFYDPYISPNWGVGTYSNFFIEDDCEKALYSFYAFIGASTPGGCISTYLEQITTGKIVYQCDAYTSPYYMPFTKRNSVVPDDVCVDVGFL